jgi:8-oxo-dGTP diphosphatase
VYTVPDSQSKTEPKTAAHAVLAAVLQVRGARLQALLWQRAREPYARAWALPGGSLSETETLEESARRHLAEKVDVRDLSHLEQLETLSEPGRNPAGRELATAYLGLVPADIDPQLPADTRWHPVDALPELAYDHATILLTARDRLRAKLSYTNLGFALAPPSFTLAELRDIYSAALGHHVTATNLQRVLLRRQLIEDTGERRHYGGGGGRPAAIYRFRNPELAITDQFAVLRPPTMGG